MQIKFILLPFLVFACKATPKSSAPPITQVEVTLNPIEDFNFKWGGFSGLKFIKKETNGDLLVSTNAADQFKIIDRKTSMSFITL